ncbi:MAG: RagB/SusD family nutrient uptake outer membrane protein [Prevotella sp.]|nr:RagB/SusD family nutrient uptake outer membrane protein [Prevotella sp.]
MKHSRYIIVLIAACALSACSSFLEENPEGSLTEEQAYNSLADLRNNAVLAIYNSIGGNQDSKGLQGTGRGVFDFNSLTTDEAIMPTRGGDWYDGGFWQTLFLHTWNPGTASMKDMWDYLYQVVMTCNDYLEIVGKYKSAHSSDADALDAYTAELRAVRAMYYFYLMDLFGNIPLVTSTDIKTTDIRQNKRSELFWFTVKELQEALPLLAPAKSNIPGDHYGRITRPVAFFLLAKLALNAEVYTHDNWTTTPRPSGSDIRFQQNGKQLNAWEYCEACCDSIDRYNYQLEQLFSDNFTPTNESSRENIFTIPMNPNLYNNWYTYFFRSRHYSHGAALGGASENGTSATIDLLNAFHYGEADEDPRFGMTFYAGTVKEEGRAVLQDDGKSPLVYYPSMVKLDLTGSDYEKTAGARLHKYANDPNANADGRACNNDIVLFRYADVLLMRAEAAVRNGIDGSDYLNKVRRRVGLSGITATLESILNERYLELAWEGWRRNDMIRFGIYGKAYTDRPQVSNEQDGHTTVFPIPADLMAMHPAWIQNPGY